MVAAEVGFDALYVGSYATSATMLGLPDTGFVGLTDMTNQVWRMRAIVDLPIIADAEAGFGNVVHVARAVQEFERAGAAAIHIEDHVFGKHIVSKPLVTPLPEAVDKIRAAVDARHDASFQIIGRTDSLRRYGLEHAIERANAFAAAGADMVFIAGLRSADIATVSRAIPVPLVNTNRPSLDPPHLTLTNEELMARGLKVVIYNDLANFLAYSAVRSGLDQLKRSGSIEGIPLDVGMREFDSFLGVSKVRSVAEQYQVAIGDPYLS
jgi:methylisocitrate lyase